MNAMDDGNIMANEADGIKECTVTVQTMPLNSSSTEDVALSTSKDPAPESAPSVDEASKSKPPPHEMSSPTPTALPASAGSSSSSRSNSDSSLTSSGSGSDSGPDPSPSPSPGPGHNSLGMDRTRSVNSKRVSNDYGDVRSSAHWDGELALSVLSARPRDAATGRRMSTMNDMSVASAAASVGAFAATDDPKEEGDAAKKQKQMEKERRILGRQGSDSSTFNDRLRRKLEESRPGAATGGGGRMGTMARRRSSRMSTASSVGSNLSAFESIDEEQQAKFGRIEGELFQRLDEAESASASANNLKSPPEMLDTLNHKQNGTAGSSPSNLKSPPENNDGLQSSYHSHNSGGAHESHRRIQSQHVLSGQQLVHEPHRRTRSEHLLRMSESSEGSVRSTRSTWSRSRRISNSSLSTEEYEEFITKKITARMDVGMTYSERKRREEEEATAAVRAAEAAAVESGEGSREEEGILSSLPAAMPDEEGAAATETVESSVLEQNSSTMDGPVSTSKSEDEINVTDHQANEESVKTPPTQDVTNSVAEIIVSDETHAMGKLRTLSSGQVIDQFYHLAPRVKDEEEEKVELSSEEEVAAETKEGAGKQEAILTAACAAISERSHSSASCTEVAGETEKQPTVIRSKSTDQLERRRASMEQISRSASEKTKEDEDLQATNNRLCRSANNSPFSSMVAQRQKVSTSYLSDPEDLVDGTDTAPQVVSDPANLEEPQRSRSELSSSIIGRFRRGSGVHRTRSLDLGNMDVTQSTTSNPENRRGTYVFGTDSNHSGIQEQRTLRELADLVEAQDVVQATLVVEDDKPIETVEAIPMDEEPEDARGRKRRRMKKQIVLIWCPVLLLVVVIAVAVVVIESRKGSNENNDEVDESVDAPERVYDPTLVQVRKEGVLRCGVPDKYGFSKFNNATGEKEGMTVDFCKAVAAAVLGSEYQVDLIDVTSLTRFTALAGREIDLLIWGDTHTMERDFHEKASGVGFQFTDPYFYDGLGFAGQPLAVQCADNFNWLGECKNLKICVNSGTTHVDILKDIFPSTNLVPQDTNDAFLQEFVQGGCNVIAGEQNDISEIVVRKAGYTGEFTSGEKILSKEPLAMVTRKNDQSWTDVVNWILRTLIHAEITNITQSNADELVHGHHSANRQLSLSEIDLVNALRVVGNYGEIYERNMQEVVPRKGLNLLYKAHLDNQSGLHYSHPTGTIDAFRHEFAPEGKINQIMARGKLICGVLGEENQSMETDYCRALSASLFSSDTGLVDFVELSNISEDEMMKKLENGELDVIAGVSVDIHSDIIPSNMTASGLSGLAFSQPYFYGGSNLFIQGSSESKAMATSQSDADWSTYVYWVVANLIWAEENGISSSEFRKVPEVKMFGEEFVWMFRGSVLGIGNYGEVYERNIESLPPRANHNLLNDGSSPQLWNPPF